VCTATSSHLKLDSLLRGFLAGNPVARDVLPRVAERYVLKIVRRIAADLPDDIHYEVVNQAFMNLTLQKPASYNPARGSAGTFLKLTVRNALRQVRATYAPPGHVTRVRRRKGSVAAGVAAPAIVCIHELPDTNMPTVDGGVAVVEAQHDVEAILRRASPWLAASLKRLHFGEESMNKVAADVGISRFSLGRQIDEFARDVRAMA